jgi:hypothetical protein
LSLHENEASHKLGKSVTVDFTTPEGQSIVRGLARKTRSVLAERLAMSAADIDALYARGIL